MRRKKFQRGLFHVYFSKLTARTNQPLRAIKAPLEEIASLRALFLQESNFQVRYNACHERGWTDSYLVMLQDTAIGYGAIKGRQIPDRDTVFEFYIAPPFRNDSSAAFRELLIASGAEYVECQSNDALLSPMLYEFAANVSADVMLFEDHAATQHSASGATFRRRRSDDNIFEHGAEPIGDYVLEVDGEIVATGGFLLHYNFPFADLYMEVRADRRGLGYGTVVAQEVKKACYVAGRVPAARCAIDNRASRAALIKAGFRACGFLLLGRVRKPV
jgi:RimJ/RimL family protein N-acetyltransferase